MGQWAACNYQSWQHIAMIETNNLLQSQQGEFIHSLRTPRDIVND